MSSSLCWRGGACCHGARTEAPLGAPVRSPGAIDQAGGGGSSRWARRAPVYHAPRREEGTAHLASKGNEEGKGLGRRVMFFNRPLKSSLP